MTVVVTFSDTVQADFIAGLPEFTANGYTVETDGRVAFLESDMLAVLAALGEEEDGHYDGSDIWIGGTGYAAQQARWIVVRPTEGSDRAAISCEDAPATGANLTGDDLSAVDLGCKPGATYDVELLDSEDHVLQATRVTAS